MTTYKWSDITWVSSTTSNGLTKKSFTMSSVNPATDVLLFEDAPSAGPISAGDVSFSNSGSTALTFRYTNSALAGSLPVLYELTLPANFLAITTTNVVFSNGSRFLVGDNTTATTQDDTANTLAGTGGNDRIIGLGGNDTLSGGAGDDRFDLYYSTASFGNDS